MKNQSLINRYYAAHRFSSLAIATCALALAMNSCQDYEYGFTEEEIHATAIQREYVKEFQKEFPVIDPQHTWMCEPDTVYYNSTSMTRAGETPAPSVTKPVKQDDVEIVPWDNVKAALDYMVEGEPNLGKCNQSFEYIAIPNNEEEYLDYYITPQFWGRKFCAYNKVGIYYMNGNTKVELDPFWSDETGKNNFYVVYKDKSRLQLENSENEITNMPDDKYGYWRDLGHQCSTCGANKCNSCGGTGIRWNNACSFCGGDGYTSPRNNYNRCSSCNNTGVAPVDHYEFPKYKITVSAGTKWGLYLETYKTQDNKETIRWYSNAEFNDDKVVAAATFSYGGVNYCSFEDAPHNLHNGGGTGNCNDCHYGHYDKDYNDIVLVITPKPISSTYHAIKYRVMCEDLGGTFDWDFNDIVYDVIYEEGKGDNTKASIKIVLQAVGGTLPIQLKYQSNDSRHNFTSQDLHKEMNNQSPDKNGLYEPVNAKGYHKAVPSKNLHTITLDEESYPNLDIRQYVKYISVIVQQKDGMVNEVKFPLEDKTDKIPQCFMTSTNTDWSDELVCITEKYPEFSKWVAYQNLGADWWQTALDNGQEVEVKTKEN